VPGALLGPFGEAIVIVGNLAHHLPRRFVTHELCERACFLCMIPPVLGILMKEPGMAAS
jgi:hypothetical protein